MIGNNIYIGIDISFSKTGVVIFNEGKNTMSFNLVVEDHKTKPIRNVNIFRYTYNKVILPNDSYSETELNYTNRSISCSSKILNIISKNISAGDTVHVNIEGWQMSTINSSRLFQLIMLQSMVRVRLSTIPNLKLKITNIGTLKKEFTGNGHAEKVEMLHSFFTKWEGKKLLPNSKPTDVDEINDLVDAFALLVNFVAHRRGFSKPIIKKLKKKKKKVVKKPLLIANIF